MLLKKSCLQKIDLENNIWHYCAINIHIRPKLVCGTTKWSHVCGGARCFGVALNFNEFHVIMYLRAFTTVIFAKILFEK